MKDIKIPKLQEASEDGAIEIEPMLYVVCGVSDTGNHIINYVSVHYTKEDAEQGFRDKAALKTSVPGNLWKIKVINSFPAERLEKFFIDHAAVIQADKKRRKNAVMLDIIGNKDVNLLNRNLMRFSQEEIEYIHDKIK